MSEERHRRSGLEVGQHERTIMSILVLAEVHL